MKYFLKYISVALLFSSVCGCGDDSSSSQGHHDAGGGDSRTAVGRRLYRAERDGKWGYIDAKGSKAIDFTFDRARRFSEGLAPVKIGNSWGFLNMDGKMVIRPTYEEVHHSGFCEGYACVMVNGKWGCINRRGKMVFRPLSDTPVLFRDGLSPVASEKGFGFIDLRKKMCIPLQYSFARPFSESLAAVQVEGIQRGRRIIGGKWGYIDRTGRMVIEPRFARAGDFSQGLANVYLAENDNVESPVFGGYIDSSGEIVISPGRYDRGEPFSGDLAAVRVAVTGLWGYIDMEGKIKIEPAYHRAGRFSCSLAPVQVRIESGGGKWGYIDAEGAMVIPAVYDRAEPFDGDLAEVYVDSTLGHINSEGEYILIPCD